MIDNTRESKWKDRSACREFFSAAAVQLGFNPLDADSWYSIKLNDLKKIKVQKHNIDQS